MLGIYVFFLILGGAFVLASVFSGLGDKEFGADEDFGGDQDFGADSDISADNDFGADKDFAADKDLGKDVDTYAGRRYRPYLSFRFWTFLFAFFGLTGVLLTLFAEWGPTLVAGLSAGMGLFAGLGVTYVLHVANQSRGREGITEVDYKGSIARVILPISRDQRGKVRMQIKGRTVDVLAIGEDEEVVLDLGQECIVLGIEDGVARVVDSGALERWQQ